MGDPASMRREDVRGRCARASGPSQYAFGQPVSAPQSILSVGCGRVLLTLQRPAKNFTYSWTTNHTPGVLEYYRWTGFTPSTSARADSGSDTFTVDSGPKLSDRPLRGSTDRCMQPGTRALSWSQLYMHGQGSCNERGSSPKVECRPGWPGTVRPRGSHRAEIPAEASEDCWAQEERSRGPRSRGLFQYSC